MLQLNYRQKTTFLHFSMFIESYIQVAKFEDKPITKILSTKQQSNQQNNAKLKHKYGSFEDKTGKGRQLLIDKIIHNQ